MIHNEDVNQLLEDFCVLVSGKNKYSYMNEFGKQVYRETVARVRQMGDNIILLRETELKVQKLQNQLKVAEMHRDALNTMASGNNANIACQTDSSVV
jgi:hypothetical protein